MKWNIKEEQREKYLRHTKNKYKTVNINPTIAKITININTPAINQRADYQTRFCISPAMCNMRKIQFRFNDAKKWRVKKG